MQSQNYARYQCRLRDINNKLFALPDVPKIAEVTIGLSAFRHTAAPKQCKTNGTVYTKKKLSQRVFAAHNSNNIKLSETENGHFRFHFYFDGLFMRRARLRLYIWILGRPRAWSTLARVTIMSVIWHEMRISKNKKTYKKSIEATAAARINGINRRQHYTIFAHTHARARTHSQIGA